MLHNFHKKVNHIGMKKSEAITAQCFQLHKTFITSIKQISLTCHPVEREEWQVVKKDEWSWLVGWEPLDLSTLREKPGHSTERDREQKKDRKWGLKVTQRDRTVLKKNAFATCSYSRRNIHMYSFGKNGTGQVTHGYDIKRSSPFSIWHATCICDTTKLLI